MTDNDLLATLRDCFDPSLPCNIVDLGEVISAHLEEDINAPGRGIAGVPARYHALVELTLPVQDEASEAQLIAQVQNRLAGLETISGSSVKVARNLLWTPDRITPEGRRILGLNRSLNGPELVQIKLP